MKIILSAQIVSKLPGKKAKNIEIQIDSISISEHALGVLGVLKIVKGWNEKMTNSIKQSAEDIYNTVAKGKRKLRQHQSVFVEASLLYGEEIFYDTIEKLALCRDRFATCQNVLVRVEFEDTKGE